MPRCFLGMSAPAGAVHLLVAVVVSVAVIAISHCWWRWSLVASRLSVLYAAVTRPYYPTPTNSKNSGSHQRQGPSRLPSSAHYRDSSKLRAFATLNQRIGLRPPRC